MTTLSPRRDLLCFSHLRWHFVTQRPQHLLTRAAQNRRVFYFEEPWLHPASELENGPWLEPIAVSETLTVFRPHAAHGQDLKAVQQALLAAFLQAYEVRSYDAWFYTPMALRFTQSLQPVLVIYDCMDELKNFLNAPPELMALEQDLLARADVVFTGGRSLYEGKRDRHPHVYAFPSSIDAAHFAQANEPGLIEPADQRSIAHPRAGFYGVLDERFDLDLLRAIAELRPQIHFVLLGPVVKIDPATLPQAANIHYLGGKSYEELPNYLAGWDVALLPFALNEATRFISPTKTPEYLAAGRRVISTPIHDVVHDYGQEGLVEIAASAEEFAAALDRSLAPPAAEWAQRVADKLRPMSWDSTWEAMQAAMDKAEARHAQAPHAAPAHPNAEINSSEKAIMNNRTHEHGKPPATHQAPAPVRQASLRPQTSVAPFRAPGDSRLTIGRGKGSGDELPSFSSTAALRTRHTPEFDYLVVGAGFAGSVLAERIASQLNKRVLVIDKREHIAGNAYDHLDEHGLLVHRYGPHIFHTNADNVVEYLSQFTEWRPYEHRVLASVHGRLVPVPINLTTINELYGLELDAAGMQEFLSQRVVPCAHIRTSEDIVLSRVGRELYETFFRNYTRKQWGLDPSDLDASVAGRIPVRYNTDDRYFADTFQAMPLEGYTRMFERMLHHPNITVQLGVSFEEVRRQVPGAHVIYTGPIDEFFDFRYGPLPYRSLEFVHQTHDTEQFQPAAVVNYPNDHEYTRVTEFKTLTGQQHAKTSIVYEYPRASGDPYYPIPRPENAALYDRYKALADKATDVTFCGRLANYRYYNMDQVVAQALVTFERLAEQNTPELPEITPGLLQPKTTAAFGGD